MNYISQINAFWEKRKELEAEGKVLKSSHVSVYLALLHTANKCKWKSKFNLSKTELCGLAGINSRTMYKCIKDLQEFEFIQYKIRYEQRKPPVYTIKKLYQDDIPKNQDQTKIVKIPKKINGNHAAPNVLPSSSYKVLN